MSHNNSYTHHHLSSGAAYFPDMFLSPGPELTPHSTLQMLDARIKHSSDSDFALQYFINLLMSPGCRLNVKLIPILKLILTIGHHPGGGLTVTPPHPTIVSYRIESKSILSVQNTSSYLWNCLTATKWEPLKSLAWSRHIWQVSFLLFWLIIQRTVTE